MSTKFMPTILLGATRILYLFQGPRTSLVWMTKSQTNACFNEGVCTLIGVIAADAGACDNGWRGWPILSASRGKSIGLSVSRIAVIFGTHSWESCDVVMGELVKTNLARKEEIQGDDQTRSYKGSRLRSCMACVIV